MLEDVLSMWVMGVCVYGRGLRADHENETMQCVTRLIRHIMAPIKHFITDSWHFWSDC